LWFPGTEAVAAEVFVTGVTPGRRARAYPLCAGRRSHVNSGTRRRFPAGSHRSLRLEIPASVERLEPLEERVARLLRARGVGEDDAYVACAALHEALLNAVVHGCGCDPNCRVALALGLAADRLTLLVFDPGPGFEPRQLPDPLADENLARGGGRGVFFMRRLADGVSFRFPRRGGTAVRLVKRLGEAASPPRLRERPASPRGRP